MPTLISNQSQSSLSDKKRFDHTLEALRGFLSFMVVISHVLVHRTYFEPNFFPSSLGSIYLPAHLAVLIFFVLSGYVIGLSTTKMETKADITLYLKKRFVRLYPIYVVSIVLALLVAKESYSLTTILNNLTFTQISTESVIFENNPLWSLQYEVVYYLLFVPILYFKISPVLVCVLSLFVSIVNYYAFPLLDTPSITSYLIGLAFWASGLVLAKHFKSSLKNVDHTKAIGLIFFILSLFHYNVLNTALIKVINTVSIAVTGQMINFDTIYGSKVMVVLPDLAYLPYCVLFILKFSGIRFRYEQPITLFLLISPSITFLYLLKNLQNPAIISAYTAPTVFYVLGIIIYLYNGGLLNRLSRKILTIGTWLGGISYGMYILHFPILIMFGNLEIFSGSLPTYIMRVVLFLAITISFSYLLEKRFQPIVRKYLMG